MCGIILNASRLRSNLASKRRRMTASSGDDEGYILKPGDAGHGKKKKLISVIFACSVVCWYCVTRRTVARFGPCGGQSQKKRDVSYDMSEAQTISHRWKPPQPLLKISIFADEIRNNDDSISIFFV